MDCSICCEKFNKSNLKPVTCGFCVNFTACLACVKRYLLETTQTAHCMNCKHEWSRVTLVENIPKTFIGVEYKKRRQELILEIEKSMMPATQPYVEIEIERNRIQELSKEVQEIRTMKYRINSYSDRYLECELECVRKEHTIKCILKDIRDRTAKLTGHSNGNRDNRAQFIRKCPVENCKGFLSTGWKCGICKTKVCSKCHEIKKMGSILDNETEEKDGRYEDEVADEEEEEEQNAGGEHKEEEIKEGEEQNVVRGHVCDPNNVETAKLLKHDTKACPKCAAMIFKIDGCDQMFCTQCHTAFSWNTMRIETRIIHNPHYFQYLRDQANGREIARNPLDNPCAEILPDGQAFNMEMIHYVSALLNDLASFNVSKPEAEQTMVRIRKVVEKEMQLCNHIVANHYARDDAINSNRDIRIQYMMNLLAEDKYKLILQMREKQLEKTREFEMIFRTYVTAARDIILNYVNLATKDERNARKLEVYFELQNLRDYINDCFAKLQSVFGCKVWQITERPNSFDVSRQTI